MRSRYQERQLDRLIYKMFGIPLPRGNRHWCSKCKRFSCLFRKRYNKIVCLRCGFGIFDDGSGIDDMGWILGDGSDL
jgi:hypothetical protein